MEDSGTYTLRTDRNVDRLTESRLLTVPPLLKGVPLPFLSGSYSQKILLSVPEPDKEDLYIIINRIRDGSNFFLL